MGWLFGVGEVISAAGVKASCPAGVLVIGAVATPAGVAAAVAVTSEGACAMAARATLGGGQARRELPVLTQCLSKDCCTQRMCDRNLIRTRLDR